jgi:exosortase
MGTLSDALPRASGRLQGLWESAKSRNLTIAAVLLPALLLLWPLASAVVTLSLNDDRYLQVLVAPFLSCLLIYWHRAEVFANTQYSPRLGGPLLLASAVLCVALTYWQPQSGVTLRMAQSAAVLLLLSAFFLCYGPSSCRSALLPLGCLLLMIPLPLGWMDWISAAYQRGSAEMSYGLLKLTGVPVFREGMRFSLPGLDIEIAPECSGIRSSLMFSTLGILAASVYLQSGWRKLVVILATVPISILKNAVRIVSLSLLSIYVNRAFLFGPIHHQYGGILSLPVDLVLFIPLLLALRRSEGRSASN